MKAWKILPFTILWDLKGLTPSSENHSLSHPFLNGNIKDAASPQNPVIQSFKWITFVGK